VYQDYFGFVLWDLLPVSFDELAQVEVIRGPGSAIWGANAFTGVVNLVTRSPRELAGDRVRIAAGELSTREVGVLHARAREGSAYKIGGSYFEQDAFERPASLPDGTPLPPYENQGTEQTRLDARLDLERDGGTIRLDAGLADSSGVLFTGLGPFDSETLREGYVRVGRDHGTLHGSVSVDVHDSSYRGFLTPDRVDIENRSLYLDVTDHRALGEKHFLAYGANARASDFDISLTPDVHDKQDAGVFLEDEIFLGDRWRLRLGARADWFDTFGFTASPRLGLIFHATPAQSFRFAYNRAYVAPSLVESYLRFETSSVAPLPTGAFVFPILAVGNEDLEEQTLDAIDLGYTGSIGDRSTLTVSLYHNETRDLILFVPVGFYSPADPPPGWPLPPETLAVIPLPSLFSYRNLGRIEEQGVEIGFGTRPIRGLDLYASYSWQDDPEVTQEGPIPIAVNLPPEHRASAGGTFVGERVSGSLGVHWVDEAFWADVPPFTGTTDSYTLVNTSLGVELPWEGTSVSLQVTNLTDEAIQQHIFGDVLSRKAVVELRGRW
jgi:iron complex outermembrane receptor protein